MRHLLRPIRSTVPRLRISLLLAMGVPAFPCIQDGFCRCLVQPLLRARGCKTESSRGGQRRQGADKFRTSRFAKGRILADVPDQKRTPDLRKCERPRTSANVKK